VTLIVEEIMTGEITAIVAEVAVEVSAVVKTLIESKSLLEIQENGRTTSRT